MARAPAHQGILPLGLGWESLSRSQVVAPPLVRTAYRVDCAGQRCRPRFLRIWRTGSAPSSFVKIVGAEEYERQREVDALARALKENGINTPVAIDKIEMPDGDIGIVYDWIDGVHPNGSNSDQYAIGRSVGRLHDALAEVQDDFNLAAKTDARLKDLLELAESQRFGAMWSGIYSCEVAERFRGYFLDFYERMSRNLGPNHGDLHPGNLLISGTADVVFLDLEDAVHSRYWFGSDISKIAERLILPSMRKQGVDWGRQQLCAVVGGYQKIRKTRHLEKGDLATAILWGLGVSVLILARDWPPDSSVAQNELSKFAKIEHSVAEWGHLFC